MKKNKLCAIFAVIALTIGLASCGSSKQTNWGSRSDVSVMNGFQSQNFTKIIPTGESVSFEIPNSRITKKALKGLTLEEAQKKVLDEAVMELGIAVIIDPKYSYEGKGRKIKRIKVYGFAGRYDFQNQK